MLLQRVSVVACVVDPAEPTAVTQRAFDAERVRDKRFSDVPPARRITEKLGLPWHQVTALAQERLKTQKLRLAQKDSAEEADWVSTEHVAAALSIVATRLGAASVTQGAYLAERERMLADHKRRKLTVLVPTVDQIRGALQRPVHGESRRRTPYSGTWKRALEIAGLDPSPKPTQRVKGKTPAELLDMAYDAHGTQITSAEANVFAKANGIPYSQVKQPWATVIAAWKRRPSQPVTCDRSATLCVGLSTFARIYIRPGQLYKRSR
jgi:hypothetical protein